MPLPPPSPERLAQLNAGTAQTAHLMERLAVDMPVLLKTVFPDLHLDPVPAKIGITKKMILYSAALYTHYGFAPFNMLCNQHADTLKDMACYLVKHHPVSMHQKLKLIKPLADDDHFGVREWAWLALRDDITLNLEEALQILQTWTTDSSPYIRRFASEATRPRGVWCKHITALRQKPWRALPLLERLKSDPARYVQLSVGNWLHDAGKDHPDWVQSICDQWRAQSEDTYTKAIVKRALRK